MEQFIMDVEEDKDIQDKPAPRTGTAGCRTAC